MKEIIHRTISVWSLGLVDYYDGLELQQKLASLRKTEKIEDVLILLEHSPVITLGRNANISNITASTSFLEAAGIEICETNRGGDVTFHGPGQLVGYPILSLTSERRDVRKYLRNLEEVIIKTLDDFGVKGERIEGLTGVWVRNRKIAAFGVHISRWVTSHGFAFNISTPLDYFNLIIPCGIRNKGVTSLDEELGHEITISEVEPIFLKHFGQIFEYEVSQQKISNHSVQVVVISKNHKKYLLLHRVPSRGGFWQPVTGSIKKNELPIEAARRELFEETALNLDIIDLDYVHSFLLDKELVKDKTTELAFCREYSFAALTSSFDIKICSKEHDDFIWQDLAEAKNLLIWQGNKHAFDLADKIYG